MKIINTLTLQLHRGQKLKLSQERPERKVEEKDLAQNKWESKGESKTFEAKLESSYGSWV